MRQDETAWDRLAALHEENEYLRQAARSFGELAERLATELRETRRSWNTAAQAPVQASPRKRAGPAA